MQKPVATHYSTDHNLSSRIADALRAAGKELGHLKTSDLAPVDEFHIRGRKATLELAEQMQIDAASGVLDIGSGLGGPARTLAETYHCHVTGIDLTPSFCDAATEMARWVGLQDKVTFRQGDATALPFSDGSFDAAMTIHVAMNIANKDALYREAKRVLKPGAVFAIYDILQGEGGPVLFPVPWAREPSISHLATQAEMRELLRGAGLAIKTERDSTDESLASRGTRDATAVASKRSLIFTMRRSDDAGYASLRQRNRIAIQLPNRVKGAHPAMSASGPLSRRYRTFPLTFGPSDSCHMQTFRL